MNDATTLQPARPAAPERSRQPSPLSAGPADRQFRAADRRAGVTLIEVLGTLSVMLVLAISAVTLLRSITDIGKRDADDRRSRANIHRLAGDYRADIHNAQTAALSDDEAELQLVLVADTAAESNQVTTHTLTYSLHQAADSPGYEVRRHENENGTVRVESYSLGLRYAPRLRVDADFVTLLLGERAAESDAFGLSIVARRPAKPETP